MKYQFKFSRKNHLLDRRASCQTCCQTRCNPCSSTRTTMERPRPASASFSWTTRRASRWTAPRNSLAVSAAITMPRKFFSPPLYFYDSRMLFKIIVYPTNRFCLTQKFDKKVTVKRSIVVQDQGGRDPWKLGRGQVVRAQSLPFRGERGLRNLRGPEELHARSMGRLSAADARNGTRHRGHHGQWRRS